jgi:putative addiction module killer protein
MRIERSESFVRWLDGLRDRRAQTIIAARIARVGLGNLGDVKGLGGGLMELRIAFGPGYRVYFAIRGETVVVLLSGGDKDSQSRDIAKARALLESLA